MYPEISDFCIVKYKSAMIYGYIRVSTDRQTVENQRFEIEQFRQREGYRIGGWIEETISGRKDYSKRELGALLDVVEAGDIIICTELSRLGRSFFMIMEILNICMTRGCQVFAIKEGYRLGDDIQSKVLAFAFGISAEIERNLISQRTTEALARKKREGVRLGRPKGSTNKHHIMDGKAEQATRLLASGHSITEVASVCSVTRKTLYQYLNKIKCNPKTNE